MSSNSQRPVWLDQGRIPALDGLRGIAILFVLLAHVSQTNNFPMSSLSRYATVFGSLGVETFFILSGFLITVLMQREWDQTGNLNLTGFYRRRILRIVPAYVCYLMVVGLFQGVGLAELWISEWIAAVTYTVNFIPNPHWEIGHVWSLSIEEHFYLLWPAAFILLPSTLKVRSLIGCLGFCLGLRWIVLLAFPAWTKLSEICTLTRLDCIAFGCLMGLLIQQPEWRRRLDQVAKYWPVVMMTLVIALAGGEISTKIQHGVTYSVSSICLGVLIWAAVRANPGWLNQRFLSAIGVGSYSLYLWQQLFLNPKLEAWWTAFPTNIVLAGLCAWGSYRIIETPFLRLKDRNRTGGGVSMAKHRSAVTEAQALTPLG